MQKIATKVFIIASVIFGLLGIITVIAVPAGVSDYDTPLSTFLTKSMMATVFVILPSFALSVASKYLGSKN